LAYVAVDAGKAARVPDRLDALQAAAGAVTGLTAHQGIDGVLKVRKGETVLIFGASGRSARSRCSSRSGMARECWLPRPAAAQPRSFAGSAPVAWSMRGAATPTKAGP
jgi:hypothetical protein